VVLALPFLNLLKVRRGPTDYSRDPEDVRRALARLDRAADELLAGAEVTDQGLAECEEAFAHFFRYLCKKNNTKNNQRFFGPDQAAFYLNAIKLAALQHPNHNAWPLMAPIRRSVLSRFRRERVSSRNDWCRLALVTAALLDQEVALAERAVRALPPVLARIATQWVRETTVGYAPHNHVPSSRLLLQTLGAEVTGPPPLQSDPLPRDQRWALSTAIYPCYGAEGRVGLADPLAPAVCRRALQIWWEVEDGESAVGMLEWLLEAGHRQQLAEELELLDTAELTPKKRAFLGQNGAALRRYSIAAWDLCRLVNVARTAHRAGFIDESTAWHFILAAARELRRIYPSWSALGDDYILGNRYFSDNHQPDAIHRASVEWLQNSPASPWHRVPWDSFEPHSFSERSSDLM
ncbi:MAG TPA: DUF1266 domain-containing protein, partial [Polyangiaceae bacterium]